MFSFQYAETEIFNVRSRIFEFIKREVEYYISGLSILNLIISEPKLPLDNFHKMEFCFIQTTIAEEYVFPVTLAERKATETHERFDIFYTKTCLFKDIFLNSVLN